jgi:hypothetical protein
MFRFRTVSLVAAPIAALMAFSLPASAAGAGVGAGLVSGAVTGISIPPVLPTPQAFNFLSTTLEGAYAGTDCQGTFTSTAQASGGTLSALPGENYAVGAGTVNNVAVTAATDVLPGPACAVSGTLGGATPVVICTPGVGFGVYVRIAGIVYVALTGFINGHCVIVTVVAAFQPNPAQLGGNLTSAAFTGPFVAAGS